MKHDTGSNIIKLVHRIFRQAQIKLVGIVLSRFVLYIAALCVGYFLLQSFHEKKWLTFLVFAELEENDVFNSAIAIFLLTFPVVTFNWLLKNKDTLSQSRQMRDQQNEGLFTNALQLVFKENDKQANSVGLKELVRLRQNRLIDPARVDLVTTAELDLKGVSLNAADLQEVKLPGAKLQKASLPGANLYGANLQEADLQEVNLQEADLQGAKLLEAKLQGANLRGAKLRGASLEEADLKGAKLHGTDLKGVILQRANLQGANLQEANLRGADLRGTILQEANIQEADLKGASLLGAKGLTPGMIRQTINWREAILDTDLRQQAEEAGRADQAINEP